MRLIALAALIAFPAAAQDAVDWGGTGCAIVAVQGQPHVAEVTCWNRLTVSNWVTDGAIMAGEVAVAVTVHHGPGDVPDTFSLTAPGFIVAPDRFDLDEHTEGVALVFPWVGM